MGGLDIFEFCKNAVKTKSVSWIKRQHLEIYEKIYELTNFIPSKYGTRDRLWCIINNIKNIPICNLCNNKANVDFKTNTYSKYCSKCVMSSDEIKEKRAKTCFKKYGHINSGGSYLSKKKSRQTKLNRYGNENYNNRDKASKTCLNKHGYPHQSKNPEIKNKKILTNLRIRGVKNPAQCQIIKNKIKETNLKKYNKNWYFQTAECRNKRKRKNFIKNFKLLNLLDKIWLIENYRNKSVDKLADELGVCNKTILNYIHYHNIPIKLNFGFSQKAIGWLDYISEKENIYIQHSLNEGEYQVPGTNYKVDGYCQETNTCYEFLGDFWHGNLDSYEKDEINPILNMTYGKIYNKTMERLKEIENLGYNIEYIWENDWTN